MTYQSCSTNFSPLGSTTVPCLLNTSKNKNRSGGLLVNLLTKMPSRDLEILFRAATARRRLRLRNILHEKEFTH